MPLRLFRWTAWILLAVIVFATVSPIGLRPSSQFGPNIERAAAFLLLGLSFALAYPRRLPLIVLLILVITGGFEFAQTLVPGRHGHMGDLALKIGGGLIGVAAGHLTNKWQSARGKY